MAFDFPSNPANGQVYTSGGVSYIWDNQAWMKAGGGGGGGVTGDYVLKTGDTMSGPLLLSEHLTAASPALQAATKQSLASVALPTGGIVGQALAKNDLNIPVWGATIDAGNFS